MRRFSAEFLGTAVLLMSIVGSGIMAQNLTNDVGIQLLINAVATTLALFVLIRTLSPISGAHLNPLVTIYARLSKNFSSQDLLYYLVAQFLGGFFGVVVANFMFNIPAIDISQHVRSGLGLFVGEIVATVGLLTIILLNSEKAFILIPAWIGSAFFFTSSTSFANPAVTISRTFTDTFTGISPSSILQFLSGQIIALILVLGVKRLTEVY